MHAASASSATICAHGPGEQVGRVVGQPAERSEMAPRKFRRATNGRAHREAGRLDRNRGASSHRVDEWLGARVPARQHDQLRRERLAQRREPGGHARATSMTAAAADVDAHHGPAHVRRPGAADDEHDVGRVAVDVGCNAARRQRLDERVLDDASQLERRRLEVGGGSDLDREAEVRAVGEPVVRRERGHQVGEEWLETHGRTGAQIPGDARRRAVMARRDPRHARVEGVEQGLLSLALRRVEPHVERRAHHQALELGLHDPIRATGAGQAQFVATLSVHASHSCVISAGPFIVGRDRSPSGPTSSADPRRGVPTFLSSTR